MPFNDFAGFNQLNGPIPTEIGLLTKLTDLNLGKLCIGWTYWLLIEVCEMCTLTFLDCLMMTWQVLI